jgi:hypothetical protein
MHDSGIFQGMKRDVFGLTAVAAAPGVTPRSIAFDEAAIGVPYPKACAGLFCPTVAQTP